jgi:membrane protein implicated in regulation of membrane protease activity
MSPTFLRYLAFQLPGAVVVAALLIGAARYEVVQPSTAVALWLLWVAKDLALYPLLKQAYEPSGHGYPARLVDRRGKARETLDPFGYVVVSGELWRAEACAEDRPIAGGETIVVSGAVGTRLVVRRVQGAEVERST